MEVLKRAQARTRDDAITLIVYSDYRCPACRTGNAALQAVVEDRDDVDL